MEINGKPKKKPFFKSDGDVLPLVEMALGKKKVKNNI